MCTLIGQRVHFFLLPCMLIISGDGGTGKSFVDCGKESLDRFDEPPHSVWTLKGGRPMVCCPNPEGKPLNDLHQSLAPNFFSN